MKLNKSDFKLLNYLYHKHNEPVSKIAKETKLSRDQVNYKLKKYISEGLIKKFAPIINYAKLGFNKQVVLFLKIDKHKNIKKTISAIEKSQNCISFGEVLCEYDLFVNLIFKNKIEFDKFMNKILENEKIINYKIIQPNKINLFPLKFLNNNNSDEFNTTNNDSKEIELDNLDLHILKLISKNGRIKLIELATELNKTSEVVLYRLKRLKKENIILGNRIQFDMKKLQYHFNILFIEFATFNEFNRNKILEFAKTSNKINSIILNWEKPQCIVQIINKEENEVREEIKQLKKIFEEEEINIKTIPIEQDFKEVNTTPFLN